MRRLFVLLVVLGLVGPLAGCKHIAGICDCVDGCGCAAGSPQVGTPMPWMHAEAPVFDGAPVAHQTPAPAPGTHPARPVVTVSVADAD